MDDMKREKLALLEELLGFMEQNGLEQHSEDDIWDVCPSCGQENDHNGQPIQHAPNCKDTARRNELRAQIAELKKELGQ